MAGTFGQSLNLSETEFLHLKMKQTECSDETRTSWGGREGKRHEHRVRAGSSSLHGIWRRDGVGEIVATTKHTKAVLLMKSIQCYVSIKQF